jgi:ElaB/YqjD/DUF883 family membrane-anchored ribosome-binding protein
MKGRYNVATADELRKAKNDAEQEFMEARKQLSEAQKHYSKAKKKYAKAVDAWV